MDINKVVSLYNQGGKTLAEIGKEIGSSKTTISRILKNEGWILNKSTKQYNHENVNTENNKTVNTVINKTTNMVNNKTVNTGNNKTVNTVKCTFELPSDLATALKLKSALENIKMVKIVEKALRESIENKYFNIK